MTRTTRFTSLIAAGLLATSPTFAGPWDGNLDLQGSILNDLDKPAFVGTGLAQASRIDAYNGAFAGNADLDQTHFATGHAGPEKGYGDTYGWAVLDVGR